MKFCSKILAIVVLASTCGLISCTAPSSFTYQNVTISLAVACNDCTTNLANPNNPNVVDIAVGGNGGAGQCMELTATVTNAPVNPTWTIVPSGNFGVSAPPTSSGPVLTTVPPTVGTGNSIGTGQLTAGTGATNYYCSPKSVPVYTGAALVQAQAAGVPQGDVAVVVTNPTDPSNPSAVATATQLFQVFAGTSSGIVVTLIPSTPKGLTTSAVTIPHSTTYQFTGFAVGAPPCVSTACGTLPSGTLDNSVVWEVGPSGGTAVVGGSAQYGTITQTGLYTAPAIPPTTAPEVTLEADANHNILTTAYITVQ